MREILQSQILANAVVSKDLEHFLAAFLLPFFFILFFSICAHACVCVRITHAASHSFSSPQHPWHTIV